MRWCVLAVVLVPLFGAWFIKQTQNKLFPCSGPVGNPEWVALDPLFEPEEIDLLHTFIKDIGNYTSTQDADVHSRLVVVPEVPPLPNGDCPHHLMAGNLDKTACRVPGRIDVARNYMLTGGFDGLREGHTKMQSRLIFFQKFLHSRYNQTTIPQVQTLFRSPRYRDVISRVCPSRPIVDDMQLAFIMQLPGQQVATHYDTPWFIGATRYHYPMWLMVAMQQSGLFEDRWVPQVQGVAYIHKWEDNGKRKGGFFLYPNGTCGPLIRVPAKANTALVLDGSQLAHGNELYMPDEHPPKEINSKVKNDLQYIGNETWQVKSDGKLVGTYKTDELRLTLVWRQWCFRTEEEKELFHSVDPMPLEDILSVFEKDLAKRNVQLPTNRADMVDTLLAQYVRYPTPPSSWFPFNYCILPKVSRLFDPLVGPFCTA